MPSTSDYLLLAVPSILTPFTGVYGRFGNQVRYTKWNQLCECTGTGTPAPPAPPALPTGYPTSDPDPPVTSFSDLSVQLHILADGLAAMRQELHSLQRFAAPYSYELGAVHTGLTGEGSIALGDQRLIGFRYVLTTMRPGQPVYRGNPPYTWNQGWIAIQDQGSLLDELRISRGGAEWFPRSMLLADSITYDLDDGVTMTLTELFAAW